MRKKMIRSRNWRKAHLGFVGLEMLERGCGGPDGVLGLGVGK